MFVTDAFVPAAPVIVGVFTAMVAAVPIGPGTVESAPSAPLGIVKLNVAAEDEPVFVTDAFVPAAPVIVGVFTAMVAAGP